jgi:hypothetical protein
MAGALLCCGATWADDETEAVPNTIQSTVRPLGLDIVAPVMQAGSDSASAAFQTSVLPSIQQLLSVNLSETSQIDDSALLLDPSSLTLSTASDIRVYFIGEGAGYYNTLGYTLTADGEVTGDQTLIFPNASTAESYYNPESTSERTSRLPLLPGDFVDLGTADAGSILDFFLIADGYHGGTTTYGTVAENNPDSINHVVAFALPDSPYLIIGFEDLFNGGDRDFNDLLIAVDIGISNVNSLTGAPEPSLALILLAFTGLVIARPRRNKAARR